MAGAVHGREARTARRAQSFQVSMDLKIENGLDFA
jgi:hypothetical protein